MKKTNTSKTNRNQVPRIAVFKDQNHIYLDFNWHTAYAQTFEDHGLQSVFLDPHIFSTIDELQKLSIDAYIWWAWHHPHDRQNAKDKICFIDSILHRPILPNWNMYWHYDNKIRQYYLARYHGIPMPNTFISFDFSEAQKFASNIALPVISKGSSGACGFDVRRFDERQDLLEFIEQVFSPEGAKTSFPSVRQKNYVYLQEFISLPGDIRIVTIGKDVVLSYWRVNEKDWKFNINSGGRVDIKDVPISAIDLALECSRRLCMHWCAYDILLKCNKPIVTEFSAIFGIVPPDLCKQLFGSYHADVPIMQACYLIKLLRNQGYHIPKTSRYLENLRLL